MQFNNRPLQKGLLGGALHVIWTRPDQMCSCLLERLGAPSESSQCSCPLHACTRVLYATYMPYVNSNTDIIGTNQTYVYRDRCERLV